VGAWLLEHLVKARIEQAVIATAILICAAPANADDYSLNVMPSEGQTIRYDRGTASVDSAQSRSIVRIVNIPGDDKKSVSFVIGVLNASGQPINFGPENITISPVGTQPVSLTTYEEAMEAERKRQKREKFWAGVAAFGRALSASDAGSTYTSGSFGGTAGGAFFSGSYSGTQYNSGAALAAERDAREMNAQDRAELERRWAYRFSDMNNLLRTTTVNPGTIYGGIATFPITKEIKKARGPVRVVIQVDIAGERHSFEARLSDQPLSAEEARALAQRASAITPVASITTGATFGQQLQAPVAPSRSQLPPKASLPDNEIRPMIARAAETYAPGFRIGGDLVVNSFRAEGETLRLSTNLHPGSNPASVVRMVCGNSGLQSVLALGGSVSIDFKPEPINVASSDCGL
jgi:hypothetical protein